MKKASLITACILAAAIAPLAARAAAPDFVLARNGRAEAVIVVQGGVTNGLRYAATELADFLGRISGARFTVADRPVPGYRTILVGAPYKAERPEEIAIRVKNPNTLEVTGDGERGTVYAAYDLLETLGCVFVAHDYDYVPSTNYLAVAGDYAKVDAPYMYAMRQGWSWVSWFDFTYNLKLRNHFGEGLADKGGYPALARDHELSYNHSVAGQWLSKKRWGEAWKAEWFALQRGSGKREFGWVCISNEDMWKHVLQEIGEHLEKHPNVREVSVARGDTLAFCECDACTALLQQYLDPDGSEVRTAQDILFANRIGKTFAQKYPDVRFNFLPYGQRFPKNEKLKFEPNVGGCSAELWRNHGLPADTNERSLYSLAQVAALSGDTCSPYVWDYLANFHDFEIPFPNHRIFGQTAKYYKRLGVRGVYTQLQFNTASDMGAMKHWLLSKLLWNPDYDVDELIETYGRAAYGRAWRWVKEYLDLLEHARLRNRWTWYGCYVNDTSHYLTPDDCVKMYRALENAYKDLRHDGDPRCKLAQRARLSGMAAVLLRYNECVEPARRLRVALPPARQMWNEFKAILGDSSQMFGNQMTCEGSGPWSDRTMNNILTNAPAISADFTCKAAVVRADASKLTGGSKMTKQRDKDGTEYCQIKVNAAGEPENTWMNPGFAEIGYTATADDVGDWYVFATIRTGVTVPLDESSCYLGIYQGWFPNGVKLDGRRMEVANQAVPGRQGDNSWRTVSLGRRRLFEGSRIWIMNGVLHPCGFIDVQDITLVNPRLVEKTTPGDKDGKDGVTRARSIVVDAPAFDKAANVRIQDDRIDNFKYARLSNFDTNAPVTSIAWSAKAAEAGDWDVFAKVRIGAAFALDQNAAVMTLTTNAPALGGQPLAVTHVNGSEGDEAWQIVCLGRQTLAAGVKVNLVPRAAGTNDVPVPHYVDMQRVILLNPEYVGKSQPALPAPAAPAK